MMLWTAPALRHRSAIDWLCQSQSDSRRCMGHRIFECVFLIGTRSAQSIMASGFKAAQTGRTRDRTRPMLQERQKVLAKDGAGPAA